VDETKNVDLDGNGRADISIYLKEITDTGNAILKFTRLSDTLFIKGDKLAEAEGESKSEGLGKAIADSAVGQAVTGMAWWIWLIIVLVIVGAGVGYYIYHERY